MAHITSEQLAKLQQLSNIKLSNSEQELFLQKLNPIISKLEELGEYPISLSLKEREVKSEVKLEDGGEVTLRALDSTFRGEKQRQIAENIMKNIEHELINNSVSIKSVLN